MTVEVLGTTGVLPPAVGAWYARTETLSRTVVDEVRRLWLTVPFGDLDGGWRAIAPQLLELVSAAQLAAAGGAEAYLAACLGQLGIDASAFGTIAAEGFAAQSSDGRSLAGALNSSVVKVKTATALGVPARLALDAGLATLVSVAATTIEDVARQATGVGITARPVLTGYVRAVNAGACSRCVILAGRFYKWSSGFDRHPRCGCKNVPGNESVSKDLVTDPDAYVRSLDADAKRKLLGPSGAKAFDDGANLNQLVNARRKGATGTTKLYGQNVKYTTEGTTSRGMYGRLQQDLEAVDGKRYKRSAAPRLTPETIYEISENRAEARNLLVRYGYLVD